MYVMKITLESVHDVEDVLAVLSDGEEEGELNFSFGVETKQISKCGNYELDTLES
jgi:uncharacterized protein (DUF433 family)